jgi:hypothetical protein
MEALAGTLRQRRNLGDIVRDSFTFYMRDWRGFVAIGAATIPLALASSAVQIAIEDRLTQQLALVAVFIASTIPFAIVEAAAIAYLDALDSNREISEAGAYRLAFQKLGSLAGAVIRITVISIPLFLSVVGLPLAVFFIVRWLFAPQAIMLDGQTAAKSLDFSADLVKNNWWRTFGRMAAIGLFVGVLNLAVLSAISFAPDAIYALVSAILGAFTTPYFAVALTLAYFDLRLQRSAVAEPQPSA